MDLFGNVTNAANTSVNPSPSAFIAFKPKLIVQNSFSNSGGDKNMGMNGSGGEVVGMAIPAAKGTNNLFKLQSSGLASSGVHSLPLNSTNSSATTKPAFSLPYLLKS